MLHKLFILPNLIAYFPKKCDICSEIKESCKLRITLNTRTINLIDPRYHVIFTYILTF